MKLTPLNDNVIVSRLEKNLTSAGGIILRTSDEADKALVLNVGPKVDQVTEGDTVVVNWNKATKVGDNTYRIKEEDIVAVFQ